VTTGKVRDAAGPVKEATGPAALSSASRALRQTVLKDSAPFAEQALWFAESFRATEGEPLRDIRVAKAVAHLLENMSIRIRAGEILVGWHPNSHLDKGREKAVQEANDYLRAQNWRPFVCEGHLAPDYPTVVGEGLDGVLRRIEGAAAVLDPTSPDTPRREAFHRACGIALRGMQRFVRRYARLAEEMAQQADTPEWAAELREIARVCDWIATNPPRTFREAVQLTWFTYLSVVLEARPSHNCYCPGRMDQYLYPFYEADIRAGRVDEALIDELLAQFLLKCNEFDRRTMSAIVTVVAGRKPDGSDATNGLSHKMLDLADRTRMYFPGIDVSWHCNIDPDFVRRAVRLLRSGKGQPSFFNSDVIVKGLMRHGIPLEHAVDHLPSTCTETSIAGRSNPHVASPYVNIPMCLLYALFGGRHPLKGTCDEFSEEVGVSGHWHAGRWEKATAALGVHEPQTYNELRSAFDAWLRHAADGAVAHCQAGLYLQSVHRPFPLLSCFVAGCIESGTNISQGGALYNFSQPEAVGVSNVVDGLAAVKVLTEEKGTYSVEDFRRAIRADFDGWGDLRNAILRECPKHGNDVAWVNELFAEVAGAWCSALEKRRNLLGGPVFPGFLGWTVWSSYGERTPATPDGRKAGAPLANSILNCTGVRAKGFPSVVLSTSGLDQSRALGGVTFNVRFSRAALAQDKGIDGLKGLIEAAFDLGSYQIQVNVVSTETMRAAQESPEHYRDLLVRIGGYLVPFTLLPISAQDEVITRTEFGM